MALATDTPVPSPFQQIQTLLPALLATQRASWEQGIASQSLLEILRSPSVLPPQDPNRELILRYLYGLCHDAVVRASDDRRLATRVNSDDMGSSDGGALDPACVLGGMWYLLGLDTACGVEGWRGKAEGMVRYLVECAQRMELNEEEKEHGVLPDEGVLSHLASPRPCQIWSDGLYMCPPSLTSSALSTSPPSHPLLTSALNQLILMTHYLLLPSGLLAHNYNCDTRTFAPPSPNGGMHGQQAWGIGNGWACTGIIRVLYELNRHMKQDPEFGLEGRQEVKVKNVYEILLGLLDECLVHLREDGLFHNIIDDKSTFLEVGLSQMLAATIYRLLELHEGCVLDLPGLEEERRKRYEGCVEKMWIAARGKVDKWGFVREVCGSPGFNRPGTAAEGQAWGVLMEVARADWGWVKGGGV